MEQLSLFPKMNNSKCVCGNRLYLIGCKWQEQKRGHGINFRLFEDFGCKNCGYHTGLVEWRDKRSSDYARQ